MTKAIVVLLGGIVTQAFAILCWYGAWQWFGSDLLKLWFNIILPFGALMLGFLGGCGFWLAGRAVNQPGTPGLKWAAAAIAIVAVIGIRYLGYWMFEFEGVPIHTVVSFGTYMTETLGHARMDFTHGGHSTGSVELGSLGYLMEALQTAVYAVSSFGFAAKLPRAERCEPCNRWMEESESGAILKNDVGSFRAMHEALPGDAHRLAVLRATPSDGDGNVAGLMRFNWRLAECSECGNAALVETAAVHNGKYFAPVAALARTTRFDRRRAAAPPPPNPVAAPPRVFGRRPVL